MIDNDAGRVFADQNCRCHRGLDHPHFGAAHDDAGAVDLAFPEAEAVNVDGLRATDGLDERSELGVDCALDRDRRL